MPHTGPPHPSVQGGVAVVARLHVCFFAPQGDMVGPHAHTCANTARGTEASNGRGNACSPNLIINLLFLIINVDN